MLRFCEFDFWNLAYQTFDFDQTLTLTLKNSEKSENICFCVSILPFSDLHIEFGVNYNIWGYGGALTLLLTCLKRPMYSMTGYQAYIGNMTMLFSRAC